MSKPKLHVYVVHEENYDEPGYKIHGVYLTRETADAHRIKIFPKKTLGYISVTRHTVRGADEVELSRRGL